MVCLSVFAPVLAFLRVSAANLDVAGARNLSVIFPSFTSLVHTTSSCSSVNEKAATKAPASPTKSKPMGLGALRQESWGGTTRWTRVSRRWMRRLLQTPRYDRPPPMQADHSHTHTHTHTHTQHTRTVKHNKPCDRQNCALSLECLRFQAPCRHARHACAHNARVLDPDP